MPIRTVDDIRKAWGPEWSSASDEEVIGAYSKATKIPAGQVADALNWGIENRGMWGNRLSSAIDSYQANLYGLGEALGSDWAKRKRIENEVQSQIASDWARGQGAIDSYKDIGGVGDFFNYAGGLAVQSAPYMAEMLAGGLAARGLSTGLRAAANAGRAAGATEEAVTAGRAASEQLARRAEMTGIASSYPSSVGDILSNQREQADGRMDLGAAGLLGIPYALANKFGIEGALARGTTMKSGIQALDNMTGLRGVAARTAASAGKGVLQEAPSETFQEFMNQYGRMAVDPNETFFNPKSNERFAESFVGGGVLGGMFGGGMGGWRRSDQWYEKKGEEERRAAADAMLAAAQQRRQEMLQAEMEARNKRPMDLINGMLAPDPLDDKARAAREKEYADMLAAPSGRYIVDWAPGEDGKPTQQERELTLGDLLDMQDRARTQRDYTKESGTPLLGYDPRVINPFPQQLNVLPNGQAVSPEQFAALPPLAQNYLLSQGLFSPAAGMSAANAINQPAGPFTPDRVDMLLGLPTPLSEQQRRERQRQLEGTLNESSGVRVQSPETGVERELTMSEFQALQAGQLRLPVGFNIYLPQTGQAAPALPSTININPFGQAGATPQQNQILLADTTDLGTELARQRIAQGFVAPTEQKAGKGAAVAPATSTTAQKEEPAWPNRKLWTQYGLPAKSTEAGRAVFDQAVQAKANGTLDAEGFDRVVEGLRKHTNSGRAVLAAETNRVAGEKEQAAKPSLTPTAPKQPAVIVQPQGASNAVSVSGAAAVDVRQQPGNGQAVASGNASGVQAAGENQLLVQGQTQGAPAQQAGAVASNVGVPNLAGQPTGRGSDAGRAVAGGSVAGSGSNPVATVGGASSAAGVEANDGQAAAVTTGSPQGAAPAVEEDADTRETRELWDEWAAEEGAPAFGALRPHVQRFLVDQPNLDDRTKEAALSMHASAAASDYEEKQEQQANQRESKAAESDFDVNAVLEAIESLPAKMQTAVRAFMGVDLRGDLAPDFEPMNARDAARKAGYAEKSSANVTRTLQKLGVTELGVQRLHAKAGQVAIVDEAEVLAGQGDTNAFADTDRTDLFSNSTFYTALKPSEDKDTPFANSPVEAIAAAVANAVRFKTKPDQETTPRNKNIARANSALINALMAEAASRSKGPEGPKLNRLFEQEVKKSNRERTRNEVAVAKEKPTKETSTAQPRADNVIENDEQGEPLVKLSQQEQTLLIEATGKLTQAEQTALEDHYGGSLESADVQGKLADDVVAHMDGKKPKLPEVIRKIIAKLAKALTAAAVFFNVGGMNPQIASDAYARTVESMPAKVTVTQAEQRESKKADTAGRKLSPNAQRVADWIAENAEANEISQIVDPATGMMYVMKGGKIVADSPALFGKAGIGAIDAQIIGKPAAEMTDTDKVTPAGRFSLKLEQDDKYGSTITFLPTNDGGGYAIHRVYLGNPAERRTERLNSKDASDNTISYGCVNVSDAFYDEVLKKFDYSGKAFAYLLPSDASKLGQFFDLSNQNRTPAPTRTASTGQKFGTRRSRGGATYTKAELEDEIKSFVRVDALGRSINIVEDVNELLNSPLDDIRKIGEALRDPSKYGIYANNRVWIIANRIEKGNGRAAFMHEVGVHLGLERLLPQATFNALVNKIVQWADKNDGSQESKIARDAMARVPPSTPDEDVYSEVLAYFVEEAIKAGIDPTAQTQRGSAELRSWFMRLWAAFKTALLRLGFKPDAFTPQDIVNLAFGAARLEAAGTWHGTAADFKKFLHSYMNSGEGAQAYGWGTYLAQRYGIGKDYWEKDVERKTSPSELVSVTFDGRDILDGYLNNSADFAYRQLVDAGVRFSESERNMFSAVLFRLGAAYRFRVAAAKNAIATDRVFKRAPAVAASILDRFVVSRTPAYTPDGSLMRVDISVGDNETLDWDAPMSAQPQVVKDFLAANPQLANALNADGSPRRRRMNTGGDLYKALIAQAWFDMGQTVGWDGGAKADKLEAKRRASEKLDAAGIKALKFLDNSSREDPSANIEYVGQQSPDNYLMGFLKREADRYDDLNPQTFSKTVFEPARQRALTSLKDDLRRAKIFFSPDGTAERIQRDIDAVNAAKPEDYRLLWIGEKGKAYYDLKDYYLDNPRTRNLVVFNDKNIHRVATLTGADRQRTKFGSNTDSMLAYWQANPADRWTGRSPNPSSAWAANRDKAVMQGDTSVDEEMSSVDNEISTALKLFDKADKLLKAGDLKDAHEVRLKAERILHENAVRLENGGKLPFGAKKNLPPVRFKFGTNAAEAAGYEAARARFDALNKALPPSARTATNNIATIIKTAMSGIANRVVFTHDLLERAARVGLASAADFGRLYKERAQMTNNLSGRVDNVARLYSEVPDAERGRGPGTINDFLKDSTRTDAWGFTPDWLPEDKRSSVQIDPAMAKRFNALSPQSQAYARAVFEHGYKTLELKKRTILNATVSEYNALIKVAKDAGDDAEVDRLESDKSKAQTKFDSLFKTMGDSPYAPLKRFGNWVVIAESKALRQARLDDDKKRIAELEQDGKHYYVDFFESQMEALNAERQLRGLGSYDSGVDGVVVRKKEEARERLYGGDGMAAAFTKLRNQARMRLEGEQDVSKRALLEMATDMYLSALAESSARKSEMRRRGIEGDIDMLRSFVAQGYADAHMVSALAFSGTQGDAINAMRREKETGSSAEQTRKSQAFNEIVKRHADSMEYVEPNAIDGIKTAASLYYLAFSPAYYLQNLTQPWMVSLPVMAGRHDWGKTAAAIGKAGAELKDAWLGAGVSRALDLSKVPDDVKKMIEVMYDRGILTSGMNLEFKNARASSATGVIGKTGQMLGDVKEFINDIQTKVEVMNRASTAIAAYRLERAKGSSDEQAMNYVDRVLRETHGDYSMMAAPRFFNNNFGKLALQFRKYQLLQLSLMARLIRESFTGTDRKAAAKALGFVLGQTGLLAGAMGLPGFTAIAWILSKLFGDPDEPDDPEYKLRKAIGDKDTADLILKGLPARFGADLSGKLGWQNMLSVLPYTDIDMTKKSVTEIGMALTTGAAGAMAGKVVDGMASMKDGRYVEGLTKALPSGFGNAVKGADTYLRGVRNKDGELLLSPDEINFAEAVLAGVGITPTTMSAQSFRQRVSYEANKNFADRASKIKQEFVDATREGSSRQEAVDAWMRLQDVRVSNGFKRQPMQDLYDAVKESRKQERNTLNGVQFRATNRPFVERLGQI